MRSCRLESHTHTGCIYREEPGLWLRLGSIDAAVRKTVLKDYWPLLHSLGHASSTDVRVVLDAGANIGLATRLFARFFGPNTTIISIEAQQTITQYCR